MILYCDNRDDGGYTFTVHVTKGDLDLVKGWNPPDDAETMSEAIRSLAFYCEAVEGASNGA